MSDFLLKTHCIPLYISEPDKFVYTIFKCFKYYFCIHCPHCMLNGRALHYLIFFLCL